MEPLTYDGFKGLVRTSRRAWHLELRDTYNVESEDEPYGRFLRGEADTYEWLDEWLSFIREVVTHVTRVRNARDHPTRLPGDGAGQEAGQRIIEPGGPLAEEHPPVEDGLAKFRYLPRHLADGIELPQEDYWLFDDDALVLSVFSADGRTGGFAQESDPSLRAQCRDVREQVWSRAVPFAEYVR